MDSSKKEKRFADTIVEFKNKLFSKDVDAFSWNFGKAISPFGFNTVSTGDYNKEGLPVFPEWYFTVPFGQPRRIDIEKIRTFARSPWVKMCVQTIVKSILRTEWDIVPIDKEDKNNYEEKIKKIKVFLLHPNSEGDSWEDLLTSYIIDLLEIDAGILFMRRMPKTGELLELYSVDGGSLLQDIDVNRRIRAYWQYSWKNPLAAPIKFEKNEILYDMMERSTYRLYGWSPLMSVIQVVEVMMQALRYNREFYINNAIPDGIAAIEQASKDSFQKVKNTWERELKGKPHRILFLNGKLNYQQIAMNNRDMEWLEGQKWYMHMIFAVFGLSPASVGYYEDVNRAEGQNQSNNTDINAILPYLDHLEAKFTNILIPAILGEENLPFDKRTPLKYKYFPVGTREEQIVFENDLKQLNSKVISINEFRVKRGLKPFESEYSDNPFKEQEAREMVTPKLGEPNNKPEDNKKPPEPKKKTLNTTIPEELEDYKDYEDFYIKNIDKWEKKVLDKVSVINKEYTEKSFGDFVKLVFDSINTTDFIDKIKKFIKQEILNGISEAENELNIDIAISEPVSKSVDQLYSQQLDGYTINGKKWFGIKGVTNDLQLKILDSVKQGVLDKKSIGDISKDIKTIFTSAKNSEAVRIARTESNRFHNQGKLMAFKDSGVRGKKVWDSYLDDKTSEICQRLNGQTKGLDEDFDDGMGWQGLTPPAHPNCRSRINFIPDEEELQ